jgi:eukaryotic-like serine/threonine-protein kinase
VEATVAATGYAFSPALAARLARDLCAGLSAIHELGMLHRDVAPGNVLCSGADDSECFKIADFGLARVSSVATFGNVLLGTPGYCAPEQSFPEKVGPGPYTDVFAAACTLYYALTAEPYFDAQSIPETLVAVYAPERRSLLEAARLHPELRARPAACADLVALLGQSTQPDARHRIQTARGLSAVLVGLFTQPGVAALRSQ